MKLRWTLLPWDALTEVLGAFELGTQKYGANDWKRHSRASHLDAAMRHLSAFMRGEEKDTESGLSHLAHAGARILMAWGTK